MHHADKVVTVYHKEWDTERGVDSYRGTVLKDVSFFSRVATAVSTDGLNAASQIDALFEEPVCEKIFGRTNVLSPSGGLPVAMNFLLALIDEVDAAAEKETKPSAKVDAYIRKYEQKYGKYMRK